MPERVRALPANNAMDLRLGAPNLGLGGDDSYARPAAVNVDHTAVDEGCLITGRYTAA